MPLKVQPFGQPHNYGCLPTCVQAVRAFHEERLTYDVASELCDEIEPEGGCDWDTSVAALGISYDIEELPCASREENFAALMKKVEQEQTPVICHLWWDGRHAIVVVAVSMEQVEIMDPAPQPGGRVYSMPKDEFLARWQQLNYGAFWFVE